MRTPPLNVLVAVKNAYRKTGILPSVQLAQWAIESAWGTKATGKFNFFGIKAKPGESFTTCWTHEEVGAHLVSCQQDFKNFVSADDAFLAHAELLCAPQFAHAAPLKDNYAGFIKAISPPSKPAYATDPDYADKLIRLIQIQHFDQYDQPIKGAA